MTAASDNGEPGARASSPHVSARQKEQRAGSPRSPSRTAGFVACLIGALVMSTARFTAILPHAAIWAGLAIVALGWALFALSIVRRACGFKG